SHPRNPLFLSGLTRVVDVAAVNQEESGTSQSIGVNQDHRSSSSTSGISQTRSSETCYVESVRACVLPSK
ncbi:unnamed protein product, partial [Amoebophrya sp. A25]